VFTSVQTALCVAGFVLADFAWLWALRYCLFDLSDLCTSWLRTSNLLQPWFTPQLYDVAKDVCGLDSVTRQAASADISPHHTTPATNSGMRESCVRASAPCAVRT
jgi:hypothetical protein